MNSPQLLSAFEHCNRLGYWSRDWEKEQPDDVEMLRKALHVGMTTTRQDNGEAAGEECFGLGSTCGLQTSKINVHDQVIHLASLSDIITTAIRKPSEAPWGVPKPIQLGEGPTWVSGAYIAPSGTTLRRIVLASSWNDDRHFSECRAWYTLGEVCAFKMPMQLVVAVIGANRGGRRFSYWARGLRHPANKKLRFRKRTDVGSGFKSTWIEAWREDWDEISTVQWLEAMLEDDVLKDVLFRIDVPVPESKACQQIVDLAARRLDQIYVMNELPNKQLSTCDWPKKCDFIHPCHNNDSPNGRYGFVRVKYL